MENNALILIAEAMVLFFLVLWAHSLRRRFGLAHFHALIGALTAVMSWVTDAGVVEKVGNITFVVGSTVFYTSLLLSIFVVYVFDGPRSTRIAISTVLGVSIFVPIVAAILHFQMQFTGGPAITQIPIPDFRINAASATATLIDLAFLGVAWELLGKPSLKIKLWLRSYATLLGVMWLDVFLFATGAFAGTPDYLHIMKGTLISRFIISLLAFPFLYFYLSKQNRNNGVEFSNRPVLSILQRVEETENELNATRREIEKRKEAEAALRKSKELLTATGRMAKVGGWEFDAETSEILWTKETFRIHEVSMDYKPTLDKVIEFFHPDDRPELLEAFQSALDEGQSYDKEVRFITANGNHLWTRTKCEAEVVDGKVIGLKGTFQDISERKQAERESLVLKTAINQAPVGIALADEDINIYYCNPEGLGMRGGDIDDLIKIPKEAFRNWKVYKIDGEPYETKDLPLVRAIKTGTTVREDFIVKHQDGSSHICDAFAAPVIEDNKIIGGMVIFLDITKRKSAEEKIKRNEKDLHNLLEAIQAGVVVHDVEKSRVAKFNPAALKLLGLTEDQVLGKSTAEPGWGFVHENGAPMTIDEYPVNIVKKTKQPLKDYVVGITKPSENEPTWALVNATPQFDQNGHLFEIINSSMDITELKTTQSQLQEKTEQLMQAQKLESIGNLAGGIAHDFNNILSSVIGFAELALDDVEKGGTLEDNLQEIYTAGKRAKDLVAQILTFSRQTNEEVKPVNITRIAKESIKFLSSSIPTNIEIEAQIETEALVVGNPSLLQQVFLNLSSNAADAMEDGGGKLRISLSGIDADEHYAANHDLLGPGHHVLITVSDTGTGIPPDSIQSIFEPYYTSKKPGKGTGLGLASVYGTVKKYGGSIHVESGLGQGTVFTVLLPATQKRDAAMQYQSEQMPKGTESILLVDDELPIAKMGSQTLERLGYSVTTRTSSIEALELFQAKPDDFDLVVTDMTMPNLTGDKLAVELMKIRPDIPIVLCTGYSKTISDETATEIGIKAFAYKPVVKAELAKTVRKVLDEAKDTGQG